MVFCNHKIGDRMKDKKNVTILILIDGFLQYNRTYIKGETGKVTILILIDGFLQ